VNVCKPSKLPPPPYTRRVFFISSTGGERYKPPTTPLTLGGGRQISLAEEGNKVPAKVAQVQTIHSLSHGRYCGHLRAGVAYGVESMVEQICCSSQAIPPRLANLSPNAAMQAGNASDAQPFPVAISYDIDALR
jgi:hypothetical protein